MSIWHVLAESFDFGEETCSKCGQTYEVGDKHTCISARHSREMDALRYKLKDKFKVSGPHWDDSKWDGLGEAVQGQPKRGSYYWVIHKKDGTRWIALYDEEGIFQLPGNDWGYDENEIEILEEVPPLRSTP